MARSGWTCRGSVRGECEVIHRTRAAADAHCAKDDKDCGTQGGYSDRMPVAVGPKADELKAEADNQYED